MIKCSKLELSIFSRYLSSVALIVDKQKRSLGYFANQRARQKNVNCASRKQEQTRRADRNACHRNVGSLFVQVANVISFAHEVSNVADKTGLRWNA